MRTSRRGFLKTLGGVALFSIVPRHVLGNGYIAPSDQLTKGIIGTGGMGRGHVNYAGTRLVAVCDVDKNHLELGKKLVKEKIAAYHDFRDLILDPNVDIVHIATPPHWHGIMSVEAAKAGKDIWCEKPMTRTIGEGKRVMEAVQQYGRMFRLNTWFRFTDQFYGLGTPVKPLKKLVQSGLLGWPLKVTISAHTGFNWKFFWVGKEYLEPQSVPSELDYDMWLGPAPERPFNNYRFRGWRGFWDYGGGQQTDWGVHWIDSAFDGLKALGLCDREYPEAVFSTAYKDPTSFNETPSCQTTIFQYKNFHIEWAQQVAHLYNRDQGVAWVGSKATLVCNREGYELIPEKNREGELLTDRAQLVGKFEDGGIEAHATNWCKCILNKSIETNSPIEKGAFATMLAHMANISYLTGTRVVYDPQARKFVNNPKADAYLKRSYRSPWQFPKV